jgi:arylsulfatase A-like enzyme
MAQMDDSVGAILKQLDDIGEADNTIVIFTTDMPTIVNLRQDPFERTPSIRDESLDEMGGGYMNDYYAREFWRFVVVQQIAGKLALTAIRLSSDAGSGFLQPGGHQGHNRGSD